MRTSREPFALEHIQLSSLSLVGTTGLVSNVNTCAQFHRCNHAIPKSIRMSKWLKFKGVREL